MAEVAEKTAAELQAEGEELKAAIAKKNSEIAAENERLKQELAALHQVNVKKQLCPNCGSDLHSACSQPGGR